MAEQGPSEKRFTNPESRAEVIAEQICSNPGLEQYSKSTHPNLVRHVAAQYLQIVATHELEADVEKVINEIRTGVRLLLVGEPK